MDFWLPGALPAHSAQTRMCPLPSLFFYHPETVGLRVISHIYPTENEGRGGSFFWMKVLRDMLSCTTHSAKEGKRLIVNSSLTKAHICSSSSGAQGTRARTHTHTILASTCIQPETSPTWTSSLHFPLQTPPGSWRQQGRGQCGFN